MQIPKLPKPFLDCEQTSLLSSIFDAVREISVILRHSPVVQLQTENKFGDQQLHQDVHCDEVVEKHLRRNRKVRGFASEERPEFNEVIHEGEKQCESKGEQVEKKGEGKQGSQSNQFAQEEGNQHLSNSEQRSYIVTYDPLDGSSIIDTNFTVGSIFSIWPYTQTQLIGTKLSNQLNAVLALYGPRTTVIFYNRTVKKVQELTLVDDEWFLSHEHLVIKPTTKMFSPGNLRAVKDNEAYAKIVQQWIDKEYTLRYTGGLVPDIEQIFIKGHGVFANVDSPKHKAKLRVLYEAAAVGFLVEMAEGATLMKGKVSLLDYQIQTYDDRISFAAGSRQELEGLKELF